MKKFPKFLLYAAGACVFIVAAAAVALRVFLPPEKAKALLLKFAEERLHRQVELGSVRVGLVNGLEARDFKLSEAPSFSQGTFISSDRLVIRPRWLALLSKKIAIKDILLDKPVVTVVRFDDGKTFNFSSLSSTAAAAAGKPASVEPASPEKSNALSPLTFLVSQASIREGTFKFVDRSTAAQSATLEAVNLQITNVSLISPMEIKVDLNVTAKGLQAALDFEGKVELLERSVEIQKLIVSGGGARLEATGNVDASKPAPVLDLKMTLQGFDPAAFAALLPLPPDAKLKGPVSGTADIRGTPELLNHKIQISFTKTSIVYGTSFNKPVDVPMTFSLEGRLISNKNLDVQSSTFGLGGLEVKGKGSVKNVADEKRVLKLRIDSNEFPPNDLFARLPDSLPPEVKLGGTIKIGADVDGTPDRGRLDVSIDGKGTDVAYADSFHKPVGIPMRIDFKGDYTTPTAIALSALTVNLARMELEGGGFFKSAAPGSNYAFTLNSNSFPIADLVSLAPALKDYKLEGTAELRPLKIKTATTEVAGSLNLAKMEHEYFSGRDLTFKFNLTDITPDLARLNGNANLKQGPGRIKNVQKLMGDSKAAKLMLVPLSVLQRLEKVGVANVRLPSLETVNFKQIVGDYAFRSGTLDIKNFFFNATDLDATMTGTMGLSGAQALNLKTILKLAPNAVGGTLGALFQDDEGRPTVSMAVKGTVADPKIALDKQDTGKQVIEKLKGDFGKELLKGLFKK